MKFVEKKILSILIIILLGMSNVSSASFAIKSHISKRRHSKSVSHRTHTRIHDGPSVEDSITILAQLPKINTVEQIAFFILGFLSVWFPKAKVLFEKIKNLHQLFKPCAQAVQTIWKIYSGEKSNDAKILAEEKNEQEKYPKIVENAKKEIQGMGEKIDKLKKTAVKDPVKIKKEKLNTCNKTKEKIMKIFEECLNKDENEFAKHWAFQRGWDPCDYVVKDCIDHEEIIKKNNFESVEDYELVCKKFKEEGGTILFLIF